MGLSETLPYLRTDEEKKNNLKRYGDLFKYRKIYAFAAAVDKDSTSEMQMKLYCVSCCWQKQKMKITLGSK